MNKLLKYFVGGILLMFLFASCDSMLDVDSNSVVSPDENKLDNTDEDVYSLLGIWTQVDKLFTSYVVLGEVRGDLMDITDNANNDLKEVYNFDVSEDNKYNVKSDYYSIINSCNYYIATADTSILEGADKVFLKEYVAVKAIRAWTYMQMVQNYGKVKYFEKPLMSVQDAEDLDDAEIGRIELASLLINDLLPYMDEEMPDLVTIGSSDLTDLRSFIPMKFLLGDLYQWLGQYEVAAQMYYALIDDEEYMVYERSRIQRQVSGSGDAAVILSAGSVWIDYKWTNYFSINGNYPYLGKLVLMIGSTELGEGSPLDTLAFGNYEICPSDVAKNNWASQVYCYNNEVKLEASSNTSDYPNNDYRGIGLSYYTTKTRFHNSSYGALSASGGVNRGIIAKYMEMSTDETRALNLYRISTLYLRYAEAVNRAGKPNLAFAALKYGLNYTSLTVDSIVPKREKYSTYTDTSYTYVPWVDFTEKSGSSYVYGELGAGEEDTEGDVNVGLHSLGCGNSWLDDDYKIDSCGTLQDSIEQVEDLIVEEYALETAFEGGRYQDLMRVALRRSSPEEYLSNMVSAKYENAAEIKAKLMNQENWYLK